MSKKFYKSYLLIFFFLSNFMLFAQPGDGDSGGDLEGDDPAPAPINSRVALLILAAIFYAIYTFRKNKRVV